MSSFSNEWTKLYEQKKDFIYHNSQIFQLLKSFRNREIKDVINDCKMVLQYGQDRIFVLNVLLYLKEDIREHLIESIIDIAISGSQAEIGVSFEVLDSMQREFIKKNMVVIIEKNITRYIEDDLMEDNFLQIIALFKYFNMYIERQSFLIKYCKERDNKVLRQLFDDYYNFD